MGREFAAMDAGLAACEGAAAALGERSLVGASQAVRSRETAPPATLPPCPECGGAPAPSLQGHNKRFCCSRCSSAFNNRRLTRGALLHDLFMTLRYERGLAARLKVWRAMCRLAAEWRDEDNAARAGRASWSPAAAVFDRLPYLRAERGPNLRGGRR
ncbi:MAG: hypothetical protein DI565_00535 [Ancylobacter novellus]|uniref:Uncharacterized protein n=1 Tax=Ancylobacter novellus TaxID=921 RepID=A0A2W5MGB0_ANCNO|nr:MAG: hypothetical protein DI565_00535 [Ancylobacter novellus]